MNTKKCNVSVSVEIDIDQIKEQVTDVVMKQAILEVMDYVRNKLLSEIEINAANLIQNISENAVIHHIAEEFVKNQDKWWTKRYVKDSMCEATKMLIRDYCDGNEIAFDELVAKALARKYINNRMNALFNNVDRFVRDEGKNMEVENDTKGRNN